VRVRTGRRTANDFRRASNAQFFSSIPSSFPVLGFKGCWDGSDIEGVLISFFVYAHSILHRCSTEGVCWNSAGRRCEVQSRAVPWRQWRGNLALV